MPDIKINQFADGTGLLALDTNFATQQPVGGPGSTQKIPFSDIRQKIDALEKTNNLSDLGSILQAKINLGLNNVDNTSDLSKPISTATQTALDLKANISSLSAVAFSGSYADLLNKPTFSAGNGLSINIAGLNTQYAIDASVTQQGNTFNGVSQLVKTDVSGKIPLNVLPTGSTVYQGTWNAATNTPTLSNSTIEASGHFYIVSVAGTVNFGAGNISFDIGDWVISNGTVWGKVDNSDAVTSWNGAQGAIIGGIFNLSDTQAASPANNDILIYDNALTKWKNFPVNNVAFGGTDIGGTIGNAQVLNVGTSTAAAVHAATLAANSAVSTATANAIAKRDASGNCQFNIVTASLNGNATSATTATTATSVSGSFGGDVSGTQPSITVNSVGGSSSAAINSATIAANNATAINITGRIVLRDPSGNFAANNITATLVTLTGTSPAYVAGPSNALLMGYSGVVGAFFLNSVVGDVCIRQTDNSKTLRLGVNAASNAEVNIGDGLVSLTCPIFLPQTQGGFAVSGALITGLEYFEDNNTLTTNTTGALVIASFNIKYQRINRKVYMSFQDFNQNAVAASPIVFGVALPAKLRPSIIKKVLVYGQRAGVMLALEVQIDTTGIITIFGDDNGGNFQNGNIAAYFGEGFHYDI